MGRTALRIEYRYIQVPAPRAAAPEAGPAIAPMRRRANEVLARARGSLSDPVERQKLDRVQGLVNQCFSGLNKLPPGMRGALGAAMGEIVNAVAAGDLDGATALAHNMLTLINRAGQKSNEAMAMMGQLRSLAHAQEGPAQAVLMGLLATAEEGLTRAGSLGALDGVINGLAGGLALGKRMAATRAGSAEHANLLDEMRHLAADMKRDNAQAAAVAGQRGALAPEAMAKLQALKADPALALQRDTLHQLEALASRVEKAGAQLPEGLRTGAAEALGEAVAKAERGDMLGAARELQGLAGRVEQAGALGKHVNAQLELAAKLSARAKNPATEAVDQALAKVRAQLEEADSLEAVQRLEAKAGRLVALADQAAGPAGLNSAEQQELQALAGQSATAPASRRGTDALSLSPQAAANLNVDRMELEAMSTDDLDAVADAVERLEQRVPQAEAPQPAQA